MTALPEYIPCRVCRSQAKLEPVMVKSGEYVQAYLCNHCGWYRTHCDRCQAQTYGERSVYISPDEPSHATVVLTLRCPVCGNRKSAAGSTRYRKLPLRKDWKGKHTKFRTIKSEKRKLRREGKI